MVMGVDGQCYFMLDGHGPNLNKPHKLCEWHMELRETMNLSTPHTSSIQKVIKNK